MRSFVVALALVAAAAAWAWLDPHAGVSTWRRLHDEVASAQARVRALEAYNQMLEAEVQGLRSDPFEHERAVREDLRWVRPGEVLVRLPRVDVAAPPPERTGEVP